MIRSSLLLLLVSVASVTAATPLTNAAFEEGETGKPPPGWALREVAARQGFTAKVVDRDPAEGRQCLELARPDFRAFGHYVTVSQTLPATELRGRRIRFSASVRTSGLTGYMGAGLYARSQRPNFLPGHCSEMNDKPARGKEWVRRSVVIDVEADAKEVEFGFVLYMAGTVWCDAARIEDLGPAGQGNEPPAPLTDLGRGNVEAFARLLAYVRFFHPSDESATTDWGRFAIGHVAAVEAAQTPAELAGVLGELFAPVAPTLRVFVSGPSPAAAAELATPPEVAAVRVVSWRHIGGDPNGLHGRYRHERVADKEIAGATPFKKSPEPLPSPAEVYEVELGGGVSCRLPLAVYADAKGTIPRATAKARPLSKDADFPPTGDDRSTRLACVALAWGMFQHFYPYFEETKADWPAALREELVAAATDTDAAAFNLTLRRLMARLQDSHGAVRPGSGAPRYDGALPFSWDVVEGKLAVTWVDPAASLRIKVGDVVESIDGKASQRVLADAAVLASGATPQHRRYRQCADLRIGPAGQPVELSIRPAAGDPYKLSVARLPSDDSPLRGPSMREPRGERVQRPAPGVVYVDLDRFRDDEFQPVLAELLKADGVVLDVRGYPLVGTQVLRLLADKPFVDDVYSDVVNLRPDRLRTVLDTPKPPVVKPPKGRKPKVAFVTDGRAVSYAETFLAIADNTGIGTIVGEATAGSNGGVALYVLPDGTRLSWTGQKAVRADGSALHGVGIKPAVPVSRTLNGLAAGRDEALEKAIELVKPAK